jgi:hypothetical protein
MLECFETRRSEGSREGGQENGLSAARRVTFPERKSPGLVQSGDRGFSLSLVAARAGAQRPKILIERRLFDNRSISESFRLLHFCK